jgi:mono/diheme cytochrome c family protein
VDLRYASRETLLAIEEIVLRGTRAQAGMPSFGRQLNAQQVRAIQAFLVARAQESATGSAK